MQQHDGRSIKDPRPKGRGIHPSGRCLITPQAAGNVPEGIQWKPAGNAGKLVLVEPGGTPAGSPGGAPEGDETERLRYEMAELQEELLEARVAQARAEERAVVLREALDRERDQHRELVDELKAQLAEARRPWWRRLIGP
jgi:hypothetical protein